jgi:hypothetical protein
MTQKAKIITVLTGILVVSGIGVIFALDRPQRDPCTSPELALLRRIQLERGLSGKGKESHEVLRGFEEEEARCLNARAEHEARWGNATPEEKAKGLEEARREGEQHRKELEEAARLEKLHKKPLPDSELGIKPILDPDPTKVLIWTNRWLGYESGKEKSDATLIDVWAGGFANNPLQGFIEVRGKKINTPTATGPVKIISERDGVLTLKSLKGEYAVLDPEDESKADVVKTPGGVTYYFDLRTRTFQ